MNLARISICSAFLAVGLFALATWARPAVAQERAAQVPKSADGRYTGTDLEGSYQKALDAAVTRAHAAMSNSGQIADMMINWSVVSVSGTRGGIMGKHDITVTVQVAK